jgi:hypothetical protein
VSAVAEALQAFRGHVLGRSDLVRADGRRLALARMIVDGKARLLDLDDPYRLVERQLRPSQVATRNRLTTQAIARALYQEGTEGFVWWSSLEASWMNITLFDDRVRPRVTLVRSPEPLTLSMPALLHATAELGIQLEKASPSPM